MAKLEFITAGVNLEVNSVQPIGMTEPYLRQFVDRLLAVHVAIALTSLELMQSTEDVTKYDLMITSLDGRAPWQSTFDVQLDFVREKFNIPAYWLLTELQPIRPLRESIILLIQAFGVTRIEASWS